MKTKTNLRTWIRLTAATFSLAATLAQANEAKLLWEIGKADRNNAEFALAPGDFSGYRDDARFVVGRSEAKKDWPYVQPGPLDSWAGTRPHTFTVVFGVKQKPDAGACRLLVDLLDTHSVSPPKLKVVVNGRPFELPLPKGASDASIRGEPAKGRPHVARVEFPATLLRAGRNEITLTTLSGSWLLYDRVALETPAGVETELVEAQGTAIVAAEVSPAPVERDGKRCHRITVTLVHSGDIVNAVIRLDDATEQLARRMLTLASGRHTLELFVPAVSKARYATLAVTVAGETLDSRPVTLVPGVEQVVLVFKTHFDIGYTDMASNVVQRYRTTMIDQALAVVDQNRDLPTAQQFAWTIPGWPMHQILDWPQQTPERKARVERALKDGRFVIHALPFTLHTETLELEDLVRGLGHSSRIARRLGLPLPRDAKMTDVPCHSWIMPTLLRHAGVSFLHLGCNSASSSPRVPPLFWWEGADGSRVLTMYSAGGYGTGLMPPGDWPHRTWLALIHTGDNHGPPRPDEIRKLLDQAAKKLPGVTVRIGRLSDFADALLAERPDLAVVRGDMPDSWIHGPMCDPHGAKLARNIRPAIATAEALGTQLDAWKVKRPATTSAVAAAYEQSLLYGEHTWGGALWWLAKYEGGAKFDYGDTWRAVRGAGHFRRHEESWAEHTAYIEKARDLIATLLERELRALAEAAGGGPRIVVFNPLPWKRSGPAVVSRRDAPPSIAALKPAEGGDAVPVETTGGELRFIASDVPALGYRVFVPVKAELPPARLRADEKTATIESPFFKATLDPVRGAIGSLTDKRTGRELVDPSAVHGFGQYLYERFDSNSVAAYVSAYVKSRAAWAVDELGKPGLPPSSTVPYRAASPRNCALTLAQTPVSVSATMTSAARPDLPHQVTTRLVLYADAPWADLELTLHDKPADPWPEAGWICLPFNVASPRFRVGRPGSIIDPARDIIAGANHDLYAVTTGVAMLDAQDCGVGFCAPDTPLLSLGRPGGWKYDPEFVPRKAAAFVNLFNNQWTTNFRFWNEGTWTVRVRLWAFEKFDPQAGLITPSLEAREPLLAVVSDRSAGQLPLSQRGLELSRRGVQVTAFGDNPDGEGTLLRLWELTGESGPCRVMLPAGFSARSAQPVNLRGQAVGEPIPVKDGGFTINLKAFAPASFVLKR